MDSSRDSSWGVGIVFLGLLGLLMFSWISGVSVNLPHLIAARPSPAGGMDGVLFEPHGSGMLDVVIGCALLTAMAAVRKETTVRPAEVRVTR